MTKKIFLSFWLFLALGTATVTFSSCNKNNEEDDNNKKENTTDNGVIINGVKWATRNVDAPGMFAAKPEDLGMFYQWNRKKAWSATGSVTGWDVTIPEGSFWEKHNDPSPAGWRVPTLDETKTLLDTDKVSHEWISENGRNGRRFTDKATGNSIFMPAAGYRYRIDGTLVFAGGFYWSSTIYEFVEASACSMNFNNYDTYWDCDAARRNARSIRCVVE
jgi:uncharacterized protein (TIGR02145 family)